MEDDDWYFGEYVDAAANKQEDLFPKNFVKIFEPETPPRPSRTSKPRKEPEPLVPAVDAGKGLSIEDSEFSSPPAASASVQAEPGSNQETEEEVPQQSKASTQPVPTPAAPPLTAGTKLALPTTTKPVPPSAEKPGSGSFRDRINAFNKPTAPPVAQVKPSGLGSSSDSSSVAPPPSKSVPPPREPPPQKAYKRDEDPEASAPKPDVEHDERPIQPQIGRTDEGEEDQPKPTSLKDRIALLQKQQMEQAARHAEAGQKKEKQKRPIKKQVESEEHADDQVGDLGDERLEKIDSGDTASKRSMESPRDYPPPLVRSNAQPRKSR